jgi:hypothetical protein
MVIFKDYIVKTLPDYIIVNDSYKDVNQKGFVVRFLEIFGTELDDEIYNKIDELSNQYNPLTANVEYLEYFAAEMGDLPKFLENDIDFARVLTFIISIYKIKGRIKSYKALLTCLGFSNVVLNEIVPVGAQYDNGLFYDDGVFYDDDCVTCSDYEIEITTAGAITGALYQTVISLVALIEPVNARLGAVIWNGSELEIILIEISIDENGDLVYNNDADPDLELTLVNGDLIVGGPNAERYYIENGDLYYVA